MMRKGIPAVTAAAAQDRAWHTFDGWTFEYAPRTYLDGLEDARDLFASGKAEQGYDADGWHTWAARAIDELIEASKDES